MRILFVLLFACPIFADHAADKAFAIENAVLDSAHNAEVRAAEAALEKVAHDTLAARTERLLLAEPGLTATGLKITNDSSGWFFLDFSYATATAEDQVIIKAACKMLRQNYKAQAVEGDPGKVRIRRDRPFRAKADLIIAFE